MNNITYTSLPLVRSRSDSSDHSTLSGLPSTESVDQKTGKPNGWEMAAGVGLLIVTFCSVGIFELGYYGLCSLLYDSETAKADLRYFVFCMTFGALCKDAWKELVELERGPGNGVATPSQEEIAGDGISESESPAVNEDHSVLVDRQPIAIEEESSSLSESRVVVYKGPSLKIDSSHFFKLISQVAKELVEACRLVNSRSNVFNREISGLLTWPTDQQENSSKGSTETNIFEAIAEISAAKTVDLFEAVQKIRLPTEERWTIEF